MKDMLALYGIKLVEFLDGSNQVRYYAYNDNLLANMIFVEFFTIETDEELDEDEYDESEEGEEEEDDDEITQYGSQLSIIFEQNGEYYNFLMYHSLFEVGAPVLTLQTIVFVINMIERIELEKLPDYLTTICPDPLIPHLIEEKQFRATSTLLVQAKLQTVYDLIREDNARLN